MFLSSRSGIRLIIISLIEHRLIYLFDSELLLTPAAPLRISDTSTNVAFRGPEYIVAPGVEGVASLVFDVPNHARGVKGGMRDGNESEVRQTDALFEVRCIVGNPWDKDWDGNWEVCYHYLYLASQQGRASSKDIRLDLSVTIVHPLAVPKLLPEPPLPFMSTPPYPQVPTPYSYPALPTPPIQTLSRSRTSLAPTPTPSLPILSSTSPRDSLLPSIQSPTTSTIRII
jgi:hypothetical protein